MPEIVYISVDVHASQMGALTRLIQAVAVGLVPEGWGIDEDTVLEINQGQILVYGRGQAYHVRRLDAGAGVSVAIHLGAGRRG